jgi:hypothetical protein
LAIAFRKTVALRGKPVISPLLVPAQARGWRFIALHFVH